jgi:hypothetical protein
MALPEGVERISDSLLRVTIEAKSSDVSVRTTFGTDHHIGAFDSLEDAILALRVLREEELAREQEERRISGERMAEP